VAVTRPSAIATTIGVAANQSWVFLTLAHSHALDCAPGEEIFEVPYGGISRAATDRNSEGMVATSVLSHNAPFSQAEQSCLYIRTTHAPFPSVSPPSMCRSNRNGLPTHFSGSRMANRP